MIISIPMVHFRHANILLLYWSDMQICCFSIGQTSSFHYALPSSLGVFAIGCGAAGCTDLRGLRDIENCSPVHALEHFWKGCVGRKWELREKCWGVGSDDYFVLIGWIRWGFETVFGTVCEDKQVQMPVLSPTGFRKHASCMVHVTSSAAVRFYHQIRHKLLSISKSHLISAAANIKVCKWALHYSHSRLNKCRLRK